MFVLKTLLVEAEGTFGGLVERVAEYSTLSGFSDGSGSCPRAGVDLADIIAHVRPLYFMLVDDEFEVQVHGNLAELLVAGFLLELEESELQKLEEEDLDGEVHEVDVGSV